MLDNLVDSIDKIEIQCDGSLLPLKSRAGIGISVWLILKEGFVKSLDIKQTRFFLGLGGYSVTSPLNKSSYIEYQSILDATSFARILSVFIQTKFYIRNDSNIIINVGKYIYGTNYDRIQPEFISYYEKIKDEVSKAKSPIKFTLGQGWIEDNISRTYALADNLIEMPTITEVTKRIENILSGIVK